MKENLFILSIKDFFTAPMLKISFLPFIISALVLYVLFFSATSSTLDSLEHSQIHLEEQHTSIVNGITQSEKNVTDIQNPTSSTILHFLMTHAATSWLVSFFVYTIGSIFTLLFSVMLALIIIGFLTPKILSIIQKNHYPDVQMHGFGGVVENILYLIKTILVMLLLLFFLTPLYFIPLINIVAFNLPFYYFFHKMLNHDVGSTICTQEQFALINFKAKSRIRMVTFTLFLLTLVPFVGLFGSAFLVIYLGHHYFQLLEQNAQEVQQ